MLEYMFDLQKESQNKLYGVNLPDMLPERLPMHVTAAIVELGEVLHEQEAWKDWKKNPRPVVDYKLADEVADLWHFIINISLYLGMSAEDVYEAFTAKSKVNEARRNSEY